MIGFFIKKAFFDGWDNLIGLVLFNLIYIVIMGLGLWGFSTIGVINAAAAYLFLAFVLLIYSIVSGGTAAVAYNYSNYQRDAWNAFRTGIKRNIRHSLLFFLLNLFALVNLLLLLPFYMAELI